MVSFPEHPSAEPPIDPGRGHIGPLIAAALANILDENSTSALANNTMEEILQFVMSFRQMHTKIMSCPGQSSENTADIKKATKMLFAILDQGVLRIRENRAASS